MSTKKVDTYISQFPQEVQQRLNKIRNLIRKIVPEAEEAFTYGVPTFKLGGNLVNYAAFKKHIGLYPQPNAIEHFKEELKSYQTSKGTIQFPIDQPLPLDLIQKIVEFRVQELRE